MNREILFKAKRKNWKELPEEQQWVEGFYFCMIHTDGRHAHHFIMPLGTDLSLGTIIEKIQVEVDPETICQYTGLPDKGGVRKIFEGNIIKSDGGCVGMVKFGLYGGQHIGFYVEWISESAEYHRQDLGYWAPECVNIGNIFDNPELLEKGAE